MILDYVLQFFYAFLASLGFAVVLNTSGLGAVICASGGGLSWVVYRLVGLIAGSNVFVPYFCGALFLSFFAEGMARIRRCPATSYMLVGFLPLVPGGGIYKTMVCAIDGDTQLFLNSAMETLGIAGALAVGVLFGSSMVRMYYVFQLKKGHKKR